MNARVRTILWLVVIALLGLAIYSIKGILLPFIAGFFVAYILSPAVRKLESWKITRTLGTTLMVLSFFLLIVGLMFVAIPFLKDELVKLATFLPRYGERALATLEPWFNELSQIITLEEASSLRQTASSYLGSMLSWGLQLLANILTSSLALANLISLVVLTPIIAFYMLRDWPVMTAALKKLLPQDYAKTIIAQANLVNQTLAGYLRGQATACLVLASIYCIGLSIVGLNFAITIGLVTGILSFIPYFGMLIGVGAGLGVALAQFSDWTSILWVAAVFLTGQMIEGYILTPQLVGDRVGLHPVWIIFALLAGGSLFGFLGILLALPMAAALGVIVRFTLEQYQMSSLYRAGPPSLKKSQRKGAK